MSEGGKDDAKEVELFEERIAQMIDEAPRKKVVLLSGRKWGKSWLNKEYYDWYNRFK